MDGVSRVVCIVCIITAAVILAIIITIVIVVAVLASDRIGFSEYTAEYHYDYGHGHQLVVQESSFSDYSFSVRQAYNGEFYSNMFYDEFDNYIVICNRFGDPSKDGHHNCYSLTGSYYGGFHISHSFSKQSSEVECPSVPNPVLPGSKPRKLDKCDFYSARSETYLEEVWVDSDNDYPVAVHIVSYDDDGVVVSDYTMKYASFIPEKPTDKSLLKEPDGVKVYNFRHGNSASSVLDRISNLIQRFTGSDASSKIGKGSTTADKFFRRLENERKLRSVIRLPAPMIGGPMFGSAPMSMQRRDNTTIPKSFDARTAFGNCSSVIGTITDQKDCGSCWAMSTAAVLADRACINGVSNKQLSPQYMVDCYKQQLGCNGGYASTVWSDIISYGTVPESCYSFQAKDGDCPTRCSHGTTINDQMKVRPKKFYSPWSKTDTERVQAIQREIMEHGPVAASFLVFRNFYSLDGGVYHRSPTDTYVGGHMVRIIGWGVENGEDYWLVANSWGKDWNENGLFKIGRGRNECNIESTVVAGLF